MTIGARRHRRKRIGRGILSDIVSSIGLGRRRRTTGMRRRRVHRRMGRGILGDIWSGVKNVASTVAPHVLPVLANLAVKRLGGRKRRTHRRRYGGSLMNNLGTASSMVSGFGRPRGYGSMGYPRKIQM